MKSLRRIGLAIALGVLAIGFAFLAAPGIIPALPLQYVMVSLLGFVALIQGGWIVRKAWRETTDQHLPPDFERSMATPTPGADLDRMLYELEHLRQGTTEYRERIRNRLVEAAIDVIRQRDDCSREAAIEQLEEGSWTDDSVAAAYFRGQSLPPGTLLEQVREWFGDESDYEHRIRRTVEAIADVAGLETITTGEDGESGLSGFAHTLFGGLGLDRRQEEAAEKRLAEWDDDEIVYEYGDGGSYLTKRWFGVSAFAFLCFGLGLMSFEPGLLVAGSVGLVYSGYARSASPPDLSALEVERAIDEDDPEPGDEVAITVRVRNGGDSTIPDLRLIDAVPGPIRVVEGSPRIGTALRPGKVVSFSYTARVSRGEYEWPLYVIARNASGEAETQQTLPVQTGIKSMPRLKTVNSMSVRNLTTLFAGRIDTSIGGSGVEFFVEREYQPGDPMNRIDWSRRARTGELATLEFREERSANIVLMFEGRDSAYLAPDDSEQHALDRSMEAASDIFAALFDRGDQVGIAAFDTIPCWLAPGAGDEHRERARQLLGTHPALSAVPPSPGKGAAGYIDPLTHIRQRLPNHSQILLFSPLCDDYPAEVARRLDASGYLVTVLSPDPTADNTVGQRLARVERHARVRNLREHEIRVLDWPYDQPFGLALENAKQRW